MQHTAILRLRVRPAGLLAGALTTAAVNPHELRTLGVRPYADAELTLWREKLPAVANDDKEYTQPPSHKILLRLVPNPEVAPGECLVQEWCLRALGIGQDDELGRKLVQRDDDAATLIQPRPCSKTLLSPSNVKVHIRPIDANPLRKDDCKEQGAMSSSRRPQPKSTSMAAAGATPEAAESSMIVSLSPLAQLNPDPETNTLSSWLDVPDILCADLPSVFVRIYEKMRVFHDCILPVPRLKVIILCKVALLPKHGNITEQYVTISKGLTVEVRRCDSVAGQEPQERKECLAQQSFTLHQTDFPGLAFGADLSQKVRLFLNEALIVGHDVLNSLLPQDLPSLQFLNLSQDPKQWRGILERRVEEGPRDSTDLPSLPYLLLHGDTKETDLIKLATKSVSNAVVAPREASHVSLDCLDLMVSDPYVDTTSPLETLLVAALSTSRPYSVAPDDAVRTAPSFHKDFATVAHAARTRIFSQWLDKVCSSSRGTHCVIHLENLANFVRYSAPGANLEEVEDPNGLDDNEPRYGQQLVPDPFMSRNVHDLLTFLTVLPLLFRCRNTSVALARAGLNSFTPQIAAIIAVDDHRILPRCIAYGGSAKSPLPDTKFHLTVRIDGKPSHFTVRAPVVRHSYLVPPPDSSARHQVLSWFADVEGRTSSTPIDSSLLATVAEHCPGWTRTELRTLIRNALKLADPPAMQLTEDVWFRALSIQSKAIAQVFASTCLGGSRTSLWDAVCGYESEKTRLKEIVSQWIQPERLKGFGHTAAKGVLLLGPSGCGKSLIARALVSMSGLNHIALSCSNIFQKYLGESERVIREVFRQAASRPPCVVFIDEIDVIAPNRGTGNFSDSGTGVEARVISTLLNLMDGVEKQAGVYVVATARDIQSIDAALLRPGRLDEHVRLSYPDQSTIRSILDRMFPTSSVFDTSQDERLGAKSRYSIVVTATQTGSSEDPAGDTSSEELEARMRTHKIVLDRVASMLTVLAEDRAAGVTPVTCSEVQAICREAIMMAAHQQMNQRESDAASQSRFDSNHNRLLVSEGHFVVAIHRVLGRE